MKKLISLSVILLSLCFSNNAFAQFGEPELKEDEPSRSLFDEGYKFGFGFDLALNDFGFGAGGQLRIGLAPNTEAIVNVKIAGLKDPSEQTFVDYFGGRIIPEKYKRVLVSPMYIGIKQRFFAEEISDNFRVFSSLSAGPVFAFSYPYFNDSNENGFRENDVQVYQFVEPVNDPFTGLSDSDTHWGLGGEFMIGIDFGENFANLSTVQFGYTMNYFSSGIQIMEPTKAEFTQNGYNVVPSHDPRQYFGSAQLNFIFGWMW